jgi:DNA-3-methyladenine glycosylase II
VETFGDKMIYEGNVYWAFPPAQRIAALEAPELKALQFSRQKAEYAIEAARRICRGEISKEKLLALGEMEAKRAALIQLRGVGAWTADYVLMKCLRLSGAFPSADIGLHNAIKHQLNLSQKPSPEEIGRLAQGWKNWEAYATFYLWRSLI